MKLTEISDRDERAKIAEDARIRKHIGEMVGIPWTMMNLTHRDVSLSALNTTYLRLVIDPKHGERYEPEGIEHDMLMHVMPLAIRDAYKKLSSTEVDVEDMGDVWTANRYVHRWKVTPIR